MGGGSSIDDCVMMRGGANLFGLFIWAADFKPVFLPGQSEQEVPLFGQQQLSRCGALMRKGMELIVEKGFPQRSNCGIFGGEDVDKVRVIEVKLVGLLQGADPCRRCTQAPN